MSTIGFVFLAISPRKFAPGILEISTVTPMPASASLMSTDMGSATVALPASNRRVVERPPGAAASTSAFALAGSVR